MDASKLFERAMQASERGTHDYAIELFQQLLTARPDDSKARRELRNVERRRIEQAGGPNAVTRASAYLRGIPTLVKIGFNSATKQHERRMLECEKFLMHGPDEAWILELLAASAEEADYLETAVQVYEDIKEKHPSRLNSIRRLGRLYERRGEIDKAAECFTRILEVKPNDEEAGKAIKDLAAIKTMKEGQWNRAGQEGAFTKMLKNQKQAEELEQEQHTVRGEDELADRIQKVKADVEKDPRNTKILAQLADLYIRAGNREQARSVFRQIKQIDPRNLVVDRRLSELDVEEKREQITLLAEKLKKTPNDPALKSQLESATAELRAYQIQQLTAQVAAAPTELGLKYKLGYALFENGDSDRAIQQFQQSTRDPKHRKESHKMLGFCFQRKKMYDMAADQFKHALNEAPGMTGEAKEIIYQLGLCYEAQRELGKAEEAFKRIYQVDIGYKDVAKKIDEYYKRRGGGSDSPPSPQ